jgi:hypothetical protein
MAQYFNQMLKPFQKSRFYQKPLMASNTLYYAQIAHIDPLSNYLSDVLYSGLGEGAVKKLLRYVTSYFKK